MMRLFIFREFYERRFDFGMNFPLERFDSLKRERPLRKSRVFAGREGFVFLGRLRVLK